MHGIHSIQMGEWTQDHFSKRHSIMLAEFRHVSSNACESKADRVDHVRVCPAHHKPENAFTVTDSILFHRLIVSSPPRSDARCLLTRPVPVISVSPTRKSWTPFRSRISRRRRLCPRSTHSSCFYHHTTSMSTSHLGTLR